MTDPLRPGTAVPSAPSPAREPSARPVRMGVVGLGQGLHLARWARRVGIDVAAGCDTDPAARERARAHLPGVPLGGHWRDLLDADLDGVLLADDFDTHAAPALAFLERGVHVLSETAACTDAEQGRALVEAADRSQATYSFAENYVLHPHVRVLRRLAAEGALGRISLIEADYLHGMSPEAVRALTGDPAHWRGRIPSTAYCTHSLSPILAVTGAWPVEVTAFPVDTADPRRAAVMAVRLSTGALALTRNGFLQGESDAHWSRMSVHGALAAAESVRAAGERAWSVRVRREGWTRDDGAAHEEELTAPPVLLDGAPLARGEEGTVLILRGFRDTVEHGTPPPVGVREAVAASLVGVAGARSLAEGSRPVPVPLP
ncbi:Gfo/Idh/MocA family protein [Nocardiopsis changdeensis]|uniref:Gfo/Idh/MocA family protein n=1 Tax=Nocardiopsis changdeensis TaxID=2831969 RepID=UPI003F466B02